MARLIPRVSPWPLALAAALLAPTAALAQDALDEPPEVTLARDDADGAGDAPDAPAPDAGTDADSEARALFEQGRAAYDDGRYRDAWDYFHRAYLLSKRPQLLYNVGQAADRLRLDREALDAFRLYLKKLPDAENRREVENRIAALEERLGEAPAPPEADDPDDADMPEDMEAAAEAPSDQPTRSGWALRGAVGLGFFGNQINGTGVDASVGSATASVHACVGYGIARGLSLGVGLLLDAGLSPAVDVGPLNRPIDSASVLSAHLLADYYFAPERHGWHILGALGMARLSVSDSGAAIGNQDASGGAALLAGGYEWPFDRQWAIGVLGRVLVARMVDGPATHLLFAPNLAFTGMWY